MSVSVSGHYISRGESLFVYSQAASCSISLVRCSHTPKVMDDFFSKLGSPQLVGAASSQAG